VAVKESSDIKFSTFDTVLHSILLDKMSSIKLDIHTSMMGEKLAEGSGAKSCSKQITSGWWPVSIGVARGSVLGPVLFNVFINDLTQDLNAHCVNLLTVLKYGDPFISLRVKSPYREIVIDWSTENHQLQKV